MSRKARVPSSAKPEMAGPAVVASRDPAYGNNPACVVEERFAVVAHEINNPLTAAINILYLLSNMPMSEEAKKYLAIAQEQLGRASQIARQTLKFCRESRAATAVNLSRAVDKAVETSALAARQKQVSFVVEVAPELNVHAVDGELVEILTNLVSNAIHYSPERGKVGIAAICQPANVAVFISDDGPGVSLEHAPKLFQPLFTTNQESGNGLGLWISRELARRAGGDLTFVPSRKGASFALRLPYMDRPPGAAWKL